MKVKNLMGNTSTDSLGTDHGNWTRELTGMSPTTKQVVKDMQVEYIQPWSNVIVKFKIPDEIFEDLEKMYNSVMLNDKQYFGDRLVGQIEEELYVNPELLEKHIIWKDFCIQSVKNYYTNSQKQVLSEINLDLQSAKRMFRIIQGDVGSGKTIVSLLAIINTIKGNYQTALMSPTEILARQHYNLAKMIFKHMDIRIEFLTGKTEYKKRKEILSNISSGKIDLLIGTHALFQKKFFSKNWD